MDYYIDVLIKPDEEMRENLLLNKVYTKLHKALYTLKSTTIGISFPQYEVRLGKLLRVHGSRTALHQLDETEWLGGLVGYCDVTEVTAIPDIVNYQIVSRKQPTMTQAKLKRLIKRRSISEAEIKAYKAKMFARGLDEPYLELNSGSNGNSYRRYISFSKLLDSPVAGEFDQFGLSKQATVPIF